MERFWSKVDIVEGPGCWMWQACKSKLGYGVVYFRRKNEGAHRVAWILTNGEIPSGMHIDHLCRTKACVRPDHLELVTPGENTRRYYSQDFVHPTLCVNGHVIADDFYVHPVSGHRTCRACRRDSMNRWRRKMGIPARQ